MFLPYGGLIEFVNKWTINPLIHDYLFIQMVWFRRLNNLNFFHSLASYPTGDFLVNGPDLDHIKTDRGPKNIKQIV